MPPKRFGLTFTPSHALNFKLQMILRRVHAFIQHDGLGHTSGNLPTLIECFTRLLDPAPCRGRIQRLHSDGRRPRAIDVKGNVFVCRQCRANLGHPRDIHGNIRATYFRWWTRDTLQQIATVFMQSFLKAYRLRLNCSKPQASDKCHQEVCTTAGQQLYPECPNTPCRWHF